jgi:chromosomal replication initiation ATPase DnaA
MTNQEVFIKNLADYLDLEFTDFDKKRIGSYLEEYVCGLPEQKPQVITKIKTVYKYLSDDLKEKLKEGTDEVIVVKPSEIIQIISSLTGISYKKMAAKDRHSEIIIARHTAMYFVNKICHETLVGTGVLFNRDHTSVINAVRNVRNMMEGDNSKYIALFEAVTSKISTYAVKKTA